MSHILLGLAGLILGCGGGFALAKKANTWCPACGERLSAEHCRSPIESAGVDQPSRRRAQRHSIGG
jgi:hypothetical protein